MITIHAEYKDILEQYPEAIPALTKKLLRKSKWKCKNILPENYIYDYGIKECCGESLEEVINNFNNPKTIQERIDNISTLLIAMVSSLNKRKWWEAMVEISNPINVINDLYKKH